MTGERPGHSLQATALVNEAYLRLVEAPGVNCQNRAHRLGPGEVAVSVVQRFQAIEIENEHSQRQLVDDGVPQKRSQLPLERSQVVQSRQVIGDRQPVEAATVVRELCRRDADPHEQSDLQHVTLRVLEGDDPWIGEVIQEDGNGRGGAAAIAEPDARQDDGDVIKMLDRGQATHTVEREDEPQRGSHGSQRPRARSTLVYDDRGIGSRL